MFNFNDILESCSLQNKTEEKEIIQVINNLKIKDENGITTIDDSNIISPKENNNYPLVDHLDINNHCKSNLSNNENVNNSFYQNLNYDSNYVFGQYYYNPPNSAVPSPNSNFNTYINYNNFLLPNESLENINNMNYNYGYFKMQNTPQNGIMNNIDTSSNVKYKKPNIFNSRPNKLPNPSLPAIDLSELINNTTQYCLDHSGSRIIQRKYEEGTEEEKDKILESLLPNIYNLSKDVFGNYVIQRVLECSHLSKRKSKIMRELDNKIYELTFHMYGCRVIQKAIEVIDVEDVRLVFKEIKHVIFKCVEDQNGNHVIQRLLERLPEEDKLEIIKNFKKKTVELARHQYGCRVIQKIFEYCKAENYIPMVDEIMLNIYTLTQDQYGNYVIQHLIEKNTKDQDNISLILRILEDLNGKIFDLSIHKYASNVVEKLLVYGNQKVKKDIIEEILRKDDQFR